MTDIAKFLESKGLILRSGGASGADLAFELGVSDFELKEIYLPWKGFNGHKSLLFGASDAALEMASRFHPAWKECSQGAWQMHARSCYQVLGRDLATPSKFVVCWTRGGRLVGGTAQAMRIAMHYGIPVFNLAKNKDLDLVNECMRSDQVFVGL